jgi:preprotein translocase subunit Sec61beta
MIRMALNSPQQQAGVLSFYDAPARGPQISAKILLVAIAIFIVIVLVFDHQSLV